MASKMSSALRSSRRLLPSGYSYSLVSRSTTVAAARGISTTSRDLKAHNFNMPALSPTMTEGTISAWRINEGDKFAAGDVILEVETDKAQMDVEAQDDGILAKIFVKASKDAVQVGTRIGVLADIDDDVATLEIPPETPSAVPPKESSSSSSPEPPKKQESSPPSNAKSTPTSTAAEGSHKPRKNPFVPSPGLIHLLHTHNLEMSDVKGTGPGGRVLKGDVLAHVGKIDKDKPVSLAGEIAKLAKLDLSNIVPRKPSDEKTQKKDAKLEDKKEKKKVNPLEEVEVSLPISLARVITAGQVPLQDSIARAVEYANSALPPSKIPATPAELFDEILGLPSVKTQPKYSVKSTEYKPAPAAPVVADLFDEIIGIAKPKPVKVDQGLQEFTVKVPAVDRERAEFFLAKVKHSLEEEERAR